MSDKLQVSINYKNQTNSDKFEINFGQFHRNLKVFKFYWFLKFGSCFLYLKSMNQPANEAQSIRKIIAASSVGTLIEWYDFYIFGSLATVIASQFFPKTNPTAALLSTLATFAAGFIVRPFGALVFGRLGDLIGRKYTFLLTLDYYGRFYICNWSGAGL